MNPLRAVLSLIEPFLHGAHRRAQQEEFARILREGGVNISDVHIVSSPIGEALRVATIGTFWLALFLIFVGYPFASFFMLVHIPPTMAEWPSTLAWFAFGVIAFFIVAMASTLLNSGNTYKSYSGYGSRYDTQIATNDLYLSREGIRGQLSVNWNRVTSLTFEGEGTVKLTVLRRPRWLYDSLGANVLTLSFASPQDALHFAFFAHQNGVK
jgi:hypothetical protein